MMKYVIHRRFETKIKASWPNKIFLIFKNYANWNYKRRLSISFFDLSCHCYNKSSKDENDFIEML